MVYSCSFGLEGWRLSGGVDCCTETMISFIYVIGIWWREILGKFVCGVSVLLPVSLSKINRLYSVLGTGVIILQAVISEGRCCDLGNFSKTWDLLLSRPKLKKAKARLVSEFQRPEKKLGASFGLCRRSRPFLLAQSTKYTPSGLLEA